MTTTEQKIWNRLNEVRRTKATSIEHRRDLMYAEAECLRALNPDHQPIQHNNPPIHKVLMALFAGN